MIGAISKVLLINDDEELCEAIGRMLKREHLAPVVAADAQTGLERAFSARADVVLLHLGRPSTANMELCKQLRASRMRTPIVVLSQIGGGTEKVLLLEAGADDCVVKPFGPARTSDADPGPTPAGTREHSKPRVRGHRS
jgi:DNA-binding response OmpR family regulator